MLRATLNSLLQRKVRLLLSTAAIVLGVGFVAGTLVFTDTLGRSFTSIFASTVGDVVVRPAGAGGDDGPATTRTVPARLVDDLAEVDGAARADGNVTTFGVHVVGEDGKVVGAQGAPGLGANYQDAPAGHGIEGLRIADGEVPQGPDEVALDAATAERAGYDLGDEVHLVTSGEQAVLRPRLAGIADFAEGGSLNGATMTIFDEPTAQRLFLDGADAYTDVWVTAEDGVSQEELRAAVAAELPAGYEAVTGDDAAEDAGGDLMEAISFITTFLLVFAGISLVVGSFLIVNTFTILVAQRTRELALLRALGASRRQVTGSVLLEAAALGVVGATVGLAVGVLLAVGIRALFSTFGLDLSGQPLVFAPRTVVAAYVVGVLVTVLAAAVPARRASRVAPVEGLRDGAGHADASVRTRVLAGLALLAVGAGGVVAALLEAPQATWWMAGGVLGLLLGAVVAAPMLARPVLGAVGAVYRRTFGTPGQLAGQNAARNPRRTAATASALMIGLSLVTMMSVLGASAGASIDRAVGDRFVGDIVVSDVTSSGLSPTVADEVETVPGVDSVTRVRYGIGETGGQRQGIAAVDPEGLSDVLALQMREGTAAGLSQGSILVSASWAEDHGLEVGDGVDYTMPAGERQYRVAGIYEDDPVISYPFVITLETLSAAGFTDADAFLLVAVDQGASVPQVQAALEDRTADLPTVSVQDQAGFAAQQRGPIDQLVLLVYALLGLALVIAVLGIANTLALSVIERTREVGLLRAVGLARPQLRRMVRLEAAAIGLLGGVLGTLLGVLCGLVVAVTLRAEGLEVISVPWGQIGAFALASAVVAVAAAALPARRAARLDILRAIGTH